MKQLWLGLEQVLTLIEPEQQLHLAGEAIAQIVEIYVKSAHASLNGLEVKDTLHGPVLSEDFLSGLMRLFRDD